MMRCRSGANVMLALVVSSGCTFHVDGLDPVGIGAGDATTGADLAAAGGDLSGVADLVAALDEAAAADLVALPDLVVVADLTPPPDLVVVPDLQVNAGPSTDVAENVVNTWDVGEATGDTIEACNPVKRGLVSLAAETATVKVGTQAVKVNYGPNGLAYFQALYPKSRNAGWNLSSRAGLEVWVRSELPSSYGGWDYPGPTIILCGPGGYRRLAPTNNQLSRTGVTYTQLMVPLAGGNGWTVTDSGTFNLSRVDSVEFHADPERNGGTGTCSLWLDGVRFY